MGSQFSWGSEHKDNCNGLRRWGWYRYIPHLDNRILGFENNFFSTVSAGSCKALIHELLFFICASDVLSNRRDSTYSNPADTTALIQAVAVGKGLKLARAQGASPGMTSPPVIPQQVVRPAEQHGESSSFPSVMQVLVDF